MMHRLQVTLSFALSRLSAILQITAATLKDSIFPKVYRYARKGKWQVVISCIIGIIGVVLSFIEKRQGGASLLTFNSYFAFLIGIAAVTILVNSMTVGLLLYNFQMAKDERNYYYDKFRDAAAALRGNLDSLHDKGIIGPEYDEPYRDIERLTMEGLPVGWKETFIPFLETLFDELRDNTEPGDDYNRIAGDTEVKALVLNEAVSGLWVNLIRRVGMRAWVSPVIKSFWALALTILAVILGAIYFAGVSSHILTGLAIGIGCMTILLILEIGFIAVVESKEFFDDKRDIDHSPTGADAQVSQEETPHT
jgi:hypothetical protein